jgi:hypothetical protein
LKKEEKKSFSDLKKRNNITNTTSSDDVRIEKTNMVNIHIISGKVCGLGGV